MEGYHTYLAMADRDTDPVRAQVLRHLAGAEWEHATLWHGRIVELGGAEPVYHGKPGGEADSLANRAGGIRMALRRLEIEESRADRQLRRATQGLGDPESIAILEHVIEDEKDHYKELGSLLARPLPAPSRRRTKSTPRRFWMRCWPSAPRAASSPEVGSATPSTASTTASAPSSASSAASAGATAGRPASTCCWPASPA
jgi:rubrerythrin